MKTALVTTTINVPHVLRLYRRCDPDVRFFIAGDKKTPTDAYTWVYGNIDNAMFIYPEEQEQWKCSDLLGWNCIQRRNIATLEAIKWGADFLVFIDDDNSPLNRYYFDHYYGAFDDHSGLLASPEIDWFDVGQYLNPPVSHRGFPHELAHRGARLSHVVDAKIGAVAGIVLGDPDCSAVTRIARHPEVLGASHLLDSGIAVNPKFTRTVWNTQNSAVIRELAPAMLLCPQFSRYDDIIASLVCQRVMADTGHHVRFSQPFVWQNRNAHSLARDLADEQWGQENILAVQAALWKNDLPESIADKVRVCYEVLDDLMPGVSALCDAWLDDVERAMA